MPRNLKPTFFVPLTHDRLGGELQISKALNSQRFSLHEIVGNGVRLDKANKRIIVDFDASPASPGLGYLANVCLVMREPSHYARMNDERIAIIQQLAGLGHAVVVPHYREFQSDALISRVAPTARIVRGKAPPQRFEQSRNSMQTLSGTVQSSHITRIPESSMFWGRDLWVNAGRRVMRFRAGSVDEEKFGEGGLSRFLPNKVIIANKSLKGNPSVDRAIADGFKVFFVGRGNYFRPQLTKLLKQDVFERHDHVDFFAGSVGRVLLVDPSFFDSKENKQPIIDAAKAAKLMILRVPKSDVRLYPANLLPLSPGRCLVDCRAKETIALLKQHAIDAIPTVVPLVAHQIEGGGPNCIANEL